MTAETSGVGTLAAAGAGGVGKPPSVLAGDKLDEREAEPVSVGDPPSTLAGDELVERKRGASCLNSSQPMTPL